MHDPRTNESRCFGFVLFEAAADGERAMAQMCGAIVEDGGHRLHVRAARPSALPQPLREDAVVSMTPAEEVTESAEEPAVAVKADHLVPEASAASGEGAASEFTAPPPIEEDDEDHDVEHPVLPIKPQPNVAGSRRSRRSQVSANQQPQNWMQPYPQQFPMGMQMPYAGMYPAGMSPMMTPYMMPMAMAPMAMPTQPMYMAMPAPFAQSAGMMPMVAAPSAAQMSAFFPYPGVAAGQWPHQQFQE
jgi:hypothetical protein